jgi:hypothetical protein
MAPSDYSLPPEKVSEGMFTRLVGLGYPHADEEVDGQPMQVVRVPRDIFDEQRRRERSGRPPRH